MLKACSVLKRHFFVLGWHVTLTLSSASDFKIYPQHKISDEHLGKRIMLSFNCNGNTMYKMDNLLVTSNAPFPTIVLNVVNNRVAKSCFFGGFGQCLPVVCYGASLIFLSIPKGGNSEWCRWHWGNDVAAVLKTVTVDIFTFYQSLSESYHCLLIHYWLF